MATRILVVEDDIDLAAMLCIALETEFEVLCIADGKTALKSFFEFRPDLVLLDLMIPGCHGIDFCRMIRQEDDTPVIVLSAITDERTKVLAFDTGVDDYLTKPFSMAELLARVRALLRRTRKLVAERTWYADDKLMIDLAAQRVSLYGREVELSSTEFRLLDCLLRRAGQLVSREELLHCVWGEGYADATASLHIYIHYLRHKIEPDPRQPRYIITEKGRGYFFRPLAEEAKPVAGGDAWAAGQAVLSRF